MAPKHADLVLAQWEATKQHSSPVIIDGQTLYLATTALIGRRGGHVSLSEARNVLDRIDACVAVLNHQLQEGKTVYGVNTGYGGSADVRCSFGEMYKLQQAFIQHLNCGVIPISPVPASDQLAHSASLKQEWVRAAMLIRANTVARGHSCVRSSTIRTLLELLSHDILPVIPTRGSISASGDLSPLSYVAGMLEGNPAIYCWSGPPNNRQIIPASQALSSIGIKPTVFEPKEALGLVNGTAISAAAASLTLASMNNILSLSQLLTAMNVEAVLGTATSFAPFISDIRPHPGQAQVASTIFGALEGSKLATGLLESHTHTLFQDRYSLRTVPQWLGPFVEDILLANEQLKMELNSTTDNPLIDASTGDIYHGGNFQAVSVTSAMEKCRLAAQAIGRMLFYQFTEMTDPTKNRGLPPNLCVDEPSTSFTFKGVDTNMAGYISELSFLANPVHNHVVSAEMGNQALNSLALISARYTDTTVDILSIMCACTLYGTCQALDLRAMNRIFESKLKIAVNDSVLDLLLIIGVGEDWHRKAQNDVWQFVANQLIKTTTLDSKDRFAQIMKESHASSDGLLQHLSTWTTKNIITSLRLFNETRQEYIKSGDASELLGRASKRLYHFVRKELKVPMHKGVVDHPMYRASGDPSNVFERVEDPAMKRTIGHWISVINEAVKDETIMEVVVECLKEGMNAEPELMPQHPNGVSNGVH
ncbi:putative phenylalanine ammonia-lyase [Bimuria novae-zelandiae CBS 107.79]|uniref:Putative phenylalanine ammonia-lyase n=1 Tax=Bimuria novae-zelandiae CBS 107.79 TaxID=1447943 RepID=A0A6A5V382_9PLEO|nr:putative phenylalanine ammonia-lyase [Bimuria novae-zelandiae CBS 107.79]